MRIANKYNIRQEDFERMINDGLVGVQWKEYEKVYEDFLTMRQSDSCRTCIYQELSIKYKISERTVRDIVSRVGKI